MLIAQQVTMTSLASQCASTKSYSLAQKVVSKRAMNTAFKSDGMMYHGSRDSFGVNGLIKHNMRSNETKSCSICPRMANYTESHIEM